MTLNWKTVGINLNYVNALYSKGCLPLLVSTSKPGQNHLSEAAGPVQFGLAFRPLDGALQPSIEKTLEFQQGEIGNNK